MKNGNESIFVTIESELEYLRENLTEFDFNTRVKSYKRVYESEIKKCKSKVKEFEGQAAKNRIPIELKTDKYIVQMYKLVKNYDLVLSTLPEIALNSTFFNGVEKLKCKTIKSNTFFLEEVQNDCLIVRVVDENYDYMNFTSEISEIKERFPDFEEKVLFDKNFFIYFPDYTFDWLIGFKERYEEYKMQEEESIKILKDFEELVSRVMDSK